MSEIKNIPLARPSIGAKEEEAVLRVLRSGWLTTGAETIAFEKEFCSFLSTEGSKENLFCLAVNSATSGLHLALEACGVQTGDLVFMPSYTFTATAEVARYLGADPVFIDVCPNTFHMDPEALESRLNEIRLEQGNPKAVIPVHYGGLPCDMGAIMSIARKYNLKVIEDAAHSFPSLTPLPNSPSPVFAGTIGDIGVFSFYTTKTLCTGEGGMVVCKDKSTASRISLMRSHGIDRSVWDRYTTVNASWYYEVVEAGFKYNLPDVLAALGRVQLSRAWSMFETRKEIAAIYDKAFSGDGHFLLPPTGPADARHLYPLRLKPENLKISRDEFIEKLKERGIGASVHFIPLHIMPYYKNRYNLAPDDFPHTMKSYKQEISLPIWPGMSEAEISHVVEVVKSVAAEYTE
jgi:dTDP-4-amino-4,6-dideoxygalactose transaminase